MKLVNNSGQVTHYEFVNHFKFLVSSNIATY
jgi:hypothetical protein